MTMLTTGYLAGTVFVLDAESVLNPPIVEVGLNDGRGRVGRPPHWAALYMGLVGGGVETDAEAADSDLVAVVQYRGRGDRMAVEVGAVA